MAPPPPLGEQAARNARPPATHTDVSGPDKQRSLALVCSPSDTIISAECPTWPPMSSAYLQLCAIGANTRT